MAYTPTVWVNNQPPALSAANLNKLTDELGAQALVQGISHSLPTWADGAAPALTEAAPLNEMERIAAAVATSLDLTYAPTEWLSGWTPSRNAYRFNKLETAVQSNRIALDMGTSVIYFDGDFDTGDLSQWTDLHDANMSQTPPGVSVLPRPGGSGYIAKTNTTSNYPTTGNGDATMLWLGGGYSNSFLQNGQTIWLRFDFLVPTGANPNYPGAFLLSSGWNTISSFHTDPGNAPGAYSTAFMIHSHYGTPVFLFRPVGGPGAGTFTYLYQTNGAPQTEGNRIALVYDQWYSMIARITFGPDASTGSVEWTLNGISQTSANCPTIAVNQYGGIPGLGYEIGLYRNPSASTVSNIYWDNVYIGSSASSVGA